MQKFGQMQLISAGSSTMKNCSCDPFWQRYTEKKGLCREVLADEQAQSCYHYVLLVAREETSNDGKASPGIPLCFFLFES